MAGFVIVTHYTAGTPYADEMRALRDSIRRVDPALVFDSYGFVPRGDWQANVRLKVEAIAQALDAQSLPVLYVDADARMRRRPVLTETMDCDFAGHWRNQIELLGGTLYFGNTSAARRLLRAWAAEIARAPAGRWESEILQELVEKRTGELGIRVRRLPATYAKIFDLMPDVVDPVIEHFQASRRYKGLVNHGQSTKAAEHNES